MTTTILRGDCRDILPTLEADTFDTVVTSPPYWQLRSYLAHDDPDKHREIGSEPTVDEWIDTMCSVFREVKRVLKPSGNLFLNLGDSYVGSRRGADTGSTTLMGSRKNQEESRRAMVQSRRRDNELVPRSDIRVPGLKYKELVGQAWRLAFALRSGFAQCKECGTERRGDAWPIWRGSRICIDCFASCGWTEPPMTTDKGWYLRQGIVWHKTNAMPESAKDRFTKATEDVFLLTKSERCHWNYAAIQEPASENTHARVAGRSDGHPVAGWAKGAGSHDVKAHNAGDRAARNGVNPKAAIAGTDNISGYVEGKSERMGRGPGWRESRQNESFAKAISGKVLETRNPRNVWTMPTQPYKGAHYATFPPALAEKALRAGCPPGGNCLDPFGGTGTVAAEAVKLLLDCTVIELDARSVEQTRARLAGMQVPLFVKELR